MRQLLLLGVLALSAITLHTPVHARSEVVAEASYIVNGSAVRLREAPNLNAKEIGKLALGTLVKPLQKTPTQSTVSGKTAPWYQVQTANGIGWVFGGFLISANNSEDAILTLSRTKIPAESLDFNEAVTLYNLVDQAANQSKRRSAKGELELARLLFLQKSLDTINMNANASKAEKDAYKAWTNKHQKIAFYDEISGGYIVNADIFWKLADQYKKDPIGDEIAWRASQQALGGECEGFIGCMSVAAQRTEGEYLKRFPKGRYVKPTLANLTETFKYMVDDWKKPEQDTRDVDLAQWETILRPQAKNPNAKKIRDYLKQLQAMK